MDEDQGGAAIHMIVVADTSPLNYIVQLGLLHELRIIYGAIVIPHAVQQEMLHPGSPPAVRSWASSLPDWVELKRPLVLDTTLPSHLGSGESEAISLAVELGAEMLLIDDLPGRKAAEERNLPLTGTLTIVMQASLLSHRDFDTELAELTRLGFRASDDVIQRVRRAFQMQRLPGSS